MQKECLVAEVASESRWVERAHLACPSTAALAAASALAAAAAALAAASAFAFASASLQGTQRSQRSASVAAAFRVGRPHEAACTGRGHGSSRARTSFPPPPSPWSRPPSWPLPPPPPPAPQPWPSGGRPRRPEGSSSRPRWGRRPWWAPTRASPRAASRRPWQQPRPRSSRPPCRRQPQRPVCNGIGLISRHAPAHPWAASRAGRASTGCSCQALE